MPEPAIRLRLGAESDLPAVEAIQQQSPEASDWPPNDYLRYRFWVAEMDGTVAGFLVARPLAPGENEILNLAVSPRFRRRGVARALIRQIFLDLPGVHFLELRASNSAALFLYQSLGFSPVGRRPKYYADSGEDGIVLRFQPC